MDLLSRTGNNRQHRSAVLTPWQLGLFALLLGLATSGLARSPEPDALIEAAFELVIESRALSDSLNWDAPTGHYYRSARKFERQAEQLLMDAQDWRSNKRIRNRLDWLNSGMHGMRRDFYNGDVGRYARDVIYHLRYTRYALNEVFSAAEIRFAY